MNSGFLLILLEIIIKYMRVTNATENERERAREFFIIEKNIYVIQATKIDLLR